MIKFKTKLDVIMFISCLLGKLPVHFFSNNITSMFVFNHVLPYLPGVIIESIMMYKVFSKTNEKEKLFLSLCLGVGFLLKLWLPKQGQSQTKRKT
jgi:hypothetical protein